MSDHQDIYCRTPMHRQDGSKQESREFLFRKEKRRVQVIEAPQMNNVAAENLFARKKKAAVTA